MSEKPRLRFAPSPTGHLHAGNLRPAIFNWLVCQKLGGEFVLRLDDTDQARSREEYVEAIREDLAWLGIHPNLELRQSDRFSRYHEVKNQLISAGKLYPCFETPEELEGKRRRQIARGKPPVYDRAALGLSKEEVEAKTRAGERPHWRFKLSDQTYTMEDAIRGRVQVDLGTVSDPVVQRADGTWLYVLTSVIDDVDTDISHILRGDDHVTNSLVQLDMFAALGAQPPKFAHHNLLVGSDGEGLSKRKGDLSLRSLREQGIEACALSSLASLVGTSEPIQLITNMHELANLFAFSKVSRSPARFDLAELERLSARAVRGYNFAEVRPRLDAMGVAITEPTWLALRDNLDRLADIRDLSQLLEAGLVIHEVDAENKDLIAEAISLLPPSPWDQTTWKVWTKAISEATGRKGAKLFKPLRLALTGAEQGPELAKLLPLLKREEVERRLEAAKGS